jgi:photoactive yellow protein
MNIASHNPIAPLAEAIVADGLVCFEAPGLFDWLGAAPPEGLDALSFGLVAMALDGTVQHYSAAEAELTGLRPDRVVGRNFFTDVAPCTNNHIVAQRFLDEPEIDTEIDYVFTFRLAPIRVRLRLLKRRGAARMYLAVKKRD